MEKRFKKVHGSLNALMAFEAAARHLSFSRAADELGVSQPTISRHVAALENRINQPLFERHNNRISLSEAGVRLADSVLLGLGHIEAAWDDIARRPSTETFVLACTYGFAEHWLMPRFRDLQRAASGAPIKIATTDWMDCLDMDRVDAAIVWDTSLEPDRPAVALFTEEVFPVCSPNYLATHPDIANSPRALFDADLLEFDVKTSGLLTWSAWFAAHGLQRSTKRQGFLHDAYPFVIDAARAGEGVALGWRQLVEQMIADGTLVQAGPTVRTTCPVYSFQHRDPGPHLELSLRIRDWFVHETRHTADRASDTSLPEGLEGI